MATCYWNHDPQPCETYLCLDGKSQVCARCCVEKCAVDTPAWFANCAEAGHPTWPAVRSRRNVAPKLVCLESYWNHELFKAVSVKGFFESLATLIRPRLKLAHRFVESERGLAYYTRHPDGLLWKLPESWDTPIYYLAFHGEAGAVKSVLDRIGSETLLEAFRGYGKCGYRNLVYFAACNVLCGSEGEKFARDFLAASGCRAVIGYTTNVDWMHSLVTDMLFLQRFYTDPDPWNNLAAIFDSVKEDYRPAQTLGYTMMQAEGLSPNPARKTLPVL
ncbi:MAG TPA: hypothetical protein VFW91_06535 [Candidatus Binatia bacterium]|nr:hypothetical protein [Candidatus Binatia bacterium]